MPMPIRPSNSSDSGLNSYFPVNMEMLQDDLLANTLLKKTALASDGEADILFNIWKNSSVVNKENEIEKKIYSVGKNVNKNDLLKLKASGLIIGDDKKIRFTNRAANIIKTMVLGEQNSFGKQSIKKPYSIVLAEQKAPKRKSALALASVNLTAGNVPNRSIGNKSRPSSEQKFIYNKRVFNKEQGSKKEYDVRVYEGENGKYEVWGFNGPIGTRLIGQPKGEYSSRSRAISVAEEIVEYRRGRGYGDLSQSEERSHGAIKRDLPGIDFTNGDSAITPTPTPTPTREAPTREVKKPVSNETEKAPQEPSPEEQEKELETLLDEIKSGKKTSFDKFVGKISRMGTVPKKIKERFVRENLDNVYMTGSGTSRMIEEVLNEPDLSPETMEAISHISEKHNVASEWIKKIENKLLEKATGNEDWALKIIMDSHPESYGEIKNKILRERFRQHERDKYDKMARGISANSYRNKNEIIFNMSKYLTRIGAAEQPDQSKPPPKDALDEQNRKINEKINLGDKNITPQLIESELLSRGDAQRMGGPLIIKLLDYENVSPKALELIAKTFNPKKIEYDVGADQEEPEFTEMLKNIATKLLEKATGNEDWAFKMIIDSHPESYGEIKNPILRERFRLFERDEYNKQSITTNQTDMTPRSKEWELAEKRKKLRQLLEGK